MEADMVVGQNQWYHFGVGAAPILVYDLDFDPWPHEYGVPPSCGCGSNNFLECRSMSGGHCLRKDRLEAMMPGATQGRDNIGLLVVLLPDSCAMGGFTS